MEGRSAKKRAELTNSSPASRIQLGGAQHAVNQSIRATLDSIVLMEGGTGFRYSYASSSLVNRRKPHRSRTARRWARMPTWPLPPNGRTGRSAADNSAAEVAEPPKVDAKTLPNPN